MNLNVLNRIDLALERLFTSSEERVHPSQVTENWLKSLGLYGDTTAGVDVNEENALQSMAVLACVKVLAEAVAQLPLVLYRDMGEKGRERARDHRLFSLLHDAPNPEMTSFYWRETMMGHVLTRGNAYSEIEFNNAGQIMGLWPLRPDATKPVRVNRALKFETKLPSGETVILPSERVLHIPGFGYDGMQGYSPIALAREAIGLGVATEKFGAAWFGNGSRPGGAYKHPGHLSDKAHDRLKDSLEEKHRGLENAHRVAILEEGLDWVQIGVPPEDSQFLETRKFQLNEIARMYRVPPHMVGDLDRATFCLPGDVEILTTNGPKYITDVEPGENVWSLGDSGLEKSKVKHVVCSGEDEILEIKTTNRIIRANARHKILTRRKVSRPRSGQGGYQCVEWVNEYIPAGELMEGDTIVTLDRLPFGENNKCPTRDCTVGFMEFCGLLLGDGTVRPSWGVSIARAQNALYMDHYRDVIKQEFVSFGPNGNGRDRDNTQTVPVNLTEQERQTRFASVLASEELTELGFSGNARTKRVPSWVFGLSEELILAFLRGFLDADGSVDKKGRIAYHSVNKEMLSQFRHLCMSVGIPVTNLRRQKVSTTLPTGDHFDGEIFTFTCSDPGENRRIWSNDIRYQKRMLSGKPFNKKDRNYPRFGGRGFDLNGCSIARITKIKRLPPEPVYDLEVDGTHSFIANGVVVHNSNIEEQSLGFVIYTLMPWLVRGEQQMNMSLLRPEERSEYYTRFSVDGLLRGNNASRWDAYMRGLQTGVYSINDVLKLEDMNPIEGGDVHLVPLNMIPLDQVAGDANHRGTEGTEEGRGERVGHKDRRYGNDIEVRKNVETRSRNVARGRARLARSYGPVFEREAERTIKREVADVRKALRSHFGERSQRDLSTFFDWLNGFYRDHLEVWKANIMPILLNYADVVGIDVGQELGIEAMTAADIDRFITRYAENMAKKEIASSQGQIQALITEAINDVEDPVPVVEARLDEWLEKRPEKVADSNSHAALYGAVVAFYGASRIVNRMTWVANGDTCPYCMELDGKTVGIEEVFVPRDTDFQPEGAEAPMRRGSDTTHPPLHAGCDCSIVAEIG